MDSKKKSGYNMVAKRAANDFAIWRAGKSVDWDCTAGELADETGLSVQTIYNTCKRRGWDLMHGNKDRLSDDTRFMDVTAQMNGSRR